MDDPIVRMAIGYLRCIWDMEHEDGDTVADALPDIIASARKVRDRIYLESEKAGPT